MFTAIRHWLLGVAIKFFVTLGQSTWDGFFHTFFWSVKEAEESWHEGALGEIKKAWVMDTVMGYVKKKFDPGWILKQALKLFVGRMIDSLVDKLNQELGDDWTKKAHEIEQSLADRLWFIESIARRL